MARLRSNKYVYDENKDPANYRKVTAKSNPKVPVVKDTRRPIEYITDGIRGLGRPPKGEKERKELLEEFIQWSFNTDSFEIEDFALSKRINPYRFHKLRHEDPIYEDIFELAKYAFASRLKKAARLDSKVYSDQYVLKFLPIYDREYREWIVSQVTKGIEANSKINIVMQSIPSSTLVPERKSNDSD